MASKSSSHWPISILASASALVTMVSPLVMVRLLPKETIGSYKIFFLYVTMLPVFSLTGGLINGLGYWAGQGPRGRRAIRLSNGLVFVAGLLLALGAFVLSPWVASRFGWPLHYSFYLAICLLGAVCSNFLEESSIVTGSIWFGAAFLSGSELLRSVAVVLAAWLTRDLGTILLTYSVLSLAKALASAIIGYSKGLFELKPDREMLRAVWSYAFPVSLSGLLGVFSNYGDQLVLSAVIPPAEFAVYAIGCLSIPPLLILEQSVTRLMVPELSESFSRDDRASAARDYRVAVEQLTWILIPAVAGLIVFAQPIIELLFTKQYTASAGYLRFFALTYLILCVPSTPVPRALGDAKWILKAAALLAPVPLILCYVLGTHYAAYGVLTGILLSRIATKAYALRYIRSATGWKWSEFFPLGDIAIFASTSAVLGYFCVKLGPFFGGGLRWFLVCGAVFTILYFPISLILVNWRRRLTPRTAGQPTNILLFTQHLEIGGLERMVLALGRKLHEDPAWSVRVFSHDSSGGPIAREFKAAGIPVEAFKKGNGFSFATLLKLMRNIYRNRIDIIHSHDIGPLIYAVLANLLSFGRVRTVHTQHSFVHLSTGKRNALYERLFTRFLDHLIVVNDDLARTYVKLGVPEARIQLVRNGVSFASAPARSRTEKLALREALIAHLPERARPGREDLWLLYLARIHSVKGQRDAAKLWASLPPDLRRRASLIFVGPEAEKGELEAVQAQFVSVPDRTRVFFAGPSEKPDQWLAAADLFLSCSRFEGMPLGPLEAIGSGLPAVLSAIPGHRFLEKVSAQYDPEHPEQGAARIAELLEQPDFGTAEYYANLWRGSAPIREKYSIEAMVKAYERVYFF